jgi:hypothetical protein
MSGSPLQTCHPGGAAVAFVPGGVPGVPIVGVPSNEGSVMQRDELPVCVVPVSAACMVLASWGGCVPTPASQDSTVTTALAGDCCGLERELTRTAYVVVMVGQTVFGPGPSPSPSPQAYEKGPVPPVTMARRSTQEP